MGPLRQDPLCTVAAHTDVCKVGRSGFKAVPWIDCQRSVYGLYMCTFPPVGELLPLMHNSFREHLWPRNSILFWSLFVSSQAIVNMFSVWEIFFKLQFEELSLSMSPSCCCSPASSDLTFVCAYVRTARDDHRPDHHASLVEEHLQNKICLSGFGGLGVVFNIWAPQVKAWPCFAERCELFSLPGAASSPPVTHHLSRCIWPQLKITLGAGGGGRWSLIDDGILPSCYATIQSKL